MSRAEEPRLYAVGDVHGDLVRLKALLREADLIDDADAWCGGDSLLVATGDLTDRGSQGLETIAFFRALQSQGDVEVLMGNHDALILARAAEWRGETVDPDCRELFILNGGKDREAKALAADDEAFAWMQALPLMLLVDDTLFQHADSAAFYGGFGSSVEAVNAAGAELAATGRGAWRIFYEMTDGREWDAPRLGNIDRIVASFEDHLRRFEATRVVHGHTRHLGREPLVYLGGRAMNVDGTMSEGYRKTPTRGFVADLGPL